MSFSGPDPYGTSGGTEAIIPTAPEDVRIARGRSYIVFLRVNKAMVQRLRENVEDVVRILGLSGDVLVAIITRQDGVVEDSNTDDMDFQGAIRVVQVAQGVVEVFIGDASITTAKLQDAIITAIKLADGAVTTPKVADGAITQVKLDPTLKLARKVFGSTTFESLTGNLVVQDYLAKYTIPANSLAVGDVLRFKAAGQGDNGTGSNRNFFYELRLSAASVLILPALAINASTNNVPWEVEFDMHIITIGATGTARTSGHRIGNATADIETQPGNFAINTTIANDLGLGFRASVTNVSVVSELYELSVIKF